MIMVPRLMKNSQLRKFQNLQIDSLILKGLPRSRHVQQKGVWCAQNLRTALARGGNSNCIPWAVGEPAQFEFLQCVITLITWWRRRRRPGTRGTTGCARRAGEPRPPRSHPLPVWCELWTDDQEALLQEGTLKLRDRSN